MRQNADSEGRSGPPSQGEHLGIISHEGRFWDVFLELSDDPLHRDAFRALFCFSPADKDEREDPVRTAVILIEPTWEDVLERARGFEDRQLTSLLRSCLPD